MDPLALGAAVAAAAGALLVGYVLQSRSVRVGPADHRLGALAPTEVASAPARLPLKRVASSIPGFSRLLRRAGTSRLEASLELADLRLRASEFLLMRALAAGIGVTFGILAMPGLAGVLLAAGLGFVGWMLPRAYLARRTAKRLATIERQLVDLLTLVASSVRSGFSFVQSLDTAAERVGGPLEVEVRRVLADVRLGQALDDALRAWADRLPNRDLRLLVTATVVQRSAGGNLSEVLENLAQTMRERSELRQQVRALTAYPRLTAKVVALYPVGITLLLTLMSPETYLRLWTEPMGWALLGAALVVNTMAFAVMRSIVRVDY